MDCRSGVRLPPDLAGVPSHVLEVQPGRNTAWFWIIFSRDGAPLTSRHPLAGVRPGKAGPVRGGVRGQNQPAAVAPCRPAGCHRVHCQPARPGIWPPACGAARPAAGVPARLPVRGPPPGSALGVSQVRRAMGVDAEEYCCVVRGGRAAAIDGLRTTCAAPPKLPRSTVVCVCSAWEPCRRAAAWLCFVQAVALGQLL